MAHDSWICSHGNFIPQLQPLEPEAERKGKGLGPQKSGENYDLQLVDAGRWCSWDTPPLFPLHVYFHIPQARSSKAGLASSSSCWLGHTNLGGWPPGCDAGIYFLAGAPRCKKKNQRKRPQLGGFMPVHAIIHPNMFLWLRLITHKKLTTHRRLDPGSKCEHARSW